MSNYSQINSCMAISFVLLRLVWPFLQHYLAQLRAAKEGRLHVLVSSSKIITTFASNCINVLYKSCLDAKKIPKEFNEKTCRKIYRSFTVQW